MAETIIKYNVPKENKRGGSTYISASRALYTDSVTNSGDTSNITANTMWQSSEGNGSLVPTNSNNIAAGTNSVAIGSNTQTTNEGELAIGEYNKSTEGMTLFSVGDGTSDENRHNIFEVDYTGFTATNGVIEGDLQAKNGIFGDVDVKGLLNTNQLQAISGYIQTLLSDEITCDYLTVTKAAHFFKLIIDEIKATQGAIIVSPANAKIDKVDVINGGWRCYYRAKDKDGGQIYNCFEVNDQVVCQTFDAAIGTSYNVSNQYYWRLVTNTGSTTINIDGETWDAHYFDLSSSDCDRYSMTPKVGDNCVQLGNRTDTTRQAAIIISAYNSQFLDKGIKAPSIVQYQGINNYDLSAHRLNIISNGLNQFKTTTGKDLEDIIKEGDTTLNNSLTALTRSTNEAVNLINNTLDSFSSDTKVNFTAVNKTLSSHTQSISLLEQTDSRLTSAISSHTGAIDAISGSVRANSTKVANLSGTVTSHTDSISVLQQTANSLGSTISSHTNSIATINSEILNQGETIGLLSASAKTNSTNISNLQQTASSLSSTISNHTNSLITLGNDLATVKGNYVTTSKLNQTASAITSTVSANTQTQIEGLGRSIEQNYATKTELSQTTSSITATVEDDIDGKLKRTGIDITSKKITMSSDNTEFVSSTGDKTWLIGKDSNGNEIFRLGRSGNNSPILRFKKTNGSYTSYNEFTTDHININGATSFTPTCSAGLVAENGTEIRLALLQGNASAKLKVNNSTPTFTLERAGTEFYVNIDASGNVHIGILKNGQRARDNWPSSSQVQVGEIFKSDSEILVIKG